MSRLWWRQGPTGAASPSPGEPACGKGWNLIRVTIKPPYGTPASRVSLAGRWGQPRPAPELQLHLPGPQLSPPTAATGPAGKLRQRPGGLAQGLEAGGYVCVRRARPRPCSRGGICRGPGRPGHEGCAGPPAESRSREGKGGLASGRGRGCRVRSALPAPQVGLIAPCRSAAPRTLRLTQVALIRGPAGRGEAGEGAGRGHDGGRASARPLHDAAARTAGAVMSGPRAAPRTPRPTGAEDPEMPQTQ